MRESEDKGGGERMEEVMEQSGYGAPLGVNSGQQDAYCRARMASLDGITKVRGVIPDESERHSYAVAAVLGGLYGRPRDETEDSTPSRRVPSHIKQAVLTELERHEAIIEGMPDLHSVSLTVYIHGEKTECVVEYRAQAGNSKKKPRGTDDVTRQWLTHPT